MIQEAIGIDLEDENLQEIIETQSNDDGTQERVQIWNQVGRAEEDMHALSP